MSRFHHMTSAPDPTAVRAAWSDFLATGALEPARVRPHVLRAWERSLRAGCDAFLPRADVLDGEETRALLRRERRLVEIATPFLVALSRAAGTERHAAMLSDGQGRLLKTVGDEDTVADENFPQPGSLLSEEAAGANGIGTALAEGSYVELVGPEHYIEGFQQFTCQGVPLRGAAGDQRGVVSMSVRRIETAAKVRDILFCASEAAECELLAAWLSDDLLEHSVLESALEALRQDMIQRITMARLQLELAARQIAAGADSAGTIAAARQLSRKFRRQAGTWRNLVDEVDGVLQPIVLGDLVQEFADLLETETRLAGVRLVWRRGETVVVLDDLRALSQRLLSAFLGAIQVADRSSDIGIAVSRNAGKGTLTLTSRTDGRELHTQHVDAPLPG